MHDFEKALSKDSGRPDEIGAPRERQVRDFLRLLLPEKIGVAKGYVINQTGDVSKECDIVFFNKETCPRFILDADNDLRLFPIEEVYGIAEVKSTLDPDELENALLKLNSINKIYRNRYDHIPEGHEDLMLCEGWHEPFKIVFSYKSGTKWEDFEFIYRLHGLYSPDAVFLLDEGAYVKATDDTLARRNSFFKKTPFQVSTRDGDVWNEIVSRFFCEDRSRHYDEFLVYDVKGAILLLMMYTCILDATKKLTLPNYDSGDYIVFWAAQSNISFNRDGLTSAR
ncbi:MAG TPA: DUF6602 domain-containing protein [Dehalococcoidia bacterium]|nr:DUF6602 domain-containing protein [Dehalococcoidia bacterium]